MAIEIKGINNLLKKLNKLSSIETDKAIIEVAEDLRKNISNAAKEFSDTSYMYVGKGEIRKYGLSSYIDVGFSKEDAAFDLWKPLWFQQWGYFDKGLNFKGDFFIANHQFWFDEAIKNSENEIKNKLKNKIKSEIKKALE